MWKEGLEEMKFFVIGILVLLPSAFIFLLNINLHLYLNRDDLSHFIILLTIVFFLIAIRKNNQRFLKKEIAL
jgi:hypothetical protein